MRILGTSICFVIAALALVVSAADFPLGTAFYTMNVPIATIASPATNATYTGISVEQNVLHTVQVNITTNLVSSAAFCIDGSLDNTNWTPISVTNTIANTGGTCFLTANAKFSYVRLRATIATNAVGTATYLGGR